MARVAAVLLLLAMLAVADVSARKSSRRLNSGYPKSGSSPVISSPTPVSGSSPTPVSGTPPYTSSPSSGSSPVSTPPLTSTPSPTPEISSPTPVISSPSPVTIPPVTSSPTGGYGGYGSRSGGGTSGFWGRNPGRVPRVLSLLSTLVKLFGPRALKFFGSRTLMGAIKDSSPDPMLSLAREGSASLVNAYAYQDFPLSAAQIISQFNSALDSNEAAAFQASKFQQLNEGV